MYYIRSYVVLGPVEAGELTAYNTTTTVMTKTLLDCGSSMSLHGVEQGTMPR